MIFVGNTAVNPSNVSAIYVGNSLVWQTEIPELPYDYTRIDGIIFDGSSWFVTDINLSGSDQLQFTYRATAGCNVIGSYEGSSEDNNFSYYHTTNAYVRYDGSLYQPTMASNTDYVVKFGPTSFNVNGTNKSTWTQKEFTATSKMWIGMLPNSNAAKFKGTMYGNITVANKFNGIPCIRESDNEIGYYDTISHTFYENQGSGTLTAYIAD